MGRNAAYATQCPRAAYPHDCGHRCSTSVHAVRGDTAIQREWMQRQITAYHRTPNADGCHTFQGCHDQILGGGIGAAIALGMIGLCLGHASWVNAEPYRARCGRTRFV